MGVRQRPLPVAQMCLVTSPTVASTQLGPTLPPPPFPGLLYVPKTPGAEQGHFAGSIMTRHACTTAHRHALAHGHLNTHAPCIHAHIQSPAYMFTHLPACMFTVTCIYAHSYLRMCSHMLTHMHTHTCQPVYMLTDTHLHTCSHSPEYMLTQLPACTVTHMPMHTCMYAHIGSPVYISLAYTHANACSPECMPTHSPACVPVHTFMWTCIFICMHSPAHMHGCIPALSL